MWSYYGSKANIVDLYPKPKHPLIIEPFAGSARYALKYFDRDVLLVDKYEVVVKIWKWLQQCSEKDILGLPVLKESQNLNDFTWDCEGQRLFMGFQVSAADAKPRHSVSFRVSTQRPKRQRTRLKIIAANLFKIKHWAIQHGCYTEIPNHTATWFIDPPYVYGGKYYKESNKNINYPELATWSQERKGQIIVCENTKADWLPFVPVSDQKGSKHITTEAIWSNEITPYHSIQQKLI